MVKKLSSLLTGHFLVKKALNKEVKLGASYREASRKVGFYASLCREVTFEMKIYLILRVIFSGILGVGALSFMFSLCINMDDINTPDSVFIACLLLMGAGWLGILVGIKGVNYCKESCERLEGQLERLEKLLDNE